MATMIDFADLTWAQQLIVLAREAGGVELTLPERNDEARAATFD